MRHAIAIIRNAIFLIVAGLFVLTIVWAQLVCSLIPSIGRECRGPELDAWMVPFFLAPLGVPALISSLALVIGASRRWSMVRASRTAAARSEHRFS